MKSFLDIEKKIIRLATVTSTNDVLKEKISEGADPWTVVVAERQTKGRGRFDRVWTSPRGGFYGSIFLPISRTFTKHPGLVPLLGIFSAYQVVTEKGGLRDLSIKWPNDLMWGGKKLGGTLAVWEKGKGIILGIGINVNSKPDDFPLELSTRMTTVRTLLGRAMDLQQFSSWLLAVLHENYLRGEREGWDFLRSNITKVSATLGKQVTVRTAEGKTISGIAHDIGEGGELIVRGGDGRLKTLWEGEVTCH